MRQGKEVALGLAKGDRFPLRQYKDDTMDRENKYYLATATKNNSA